MRIIAIALLLFLSLTAQTQHLFNFYEDWFGLDNYFNQVVVKANQIESIHIRIEDKKDGQKFKNKGAFLHYEFNAAGQLHQSMKSLVFTNRIDTSLQNLKYNAKGLIYKKEEIHGPFHFSYYFNYENQKPISELKIDASKAKLDTLYYRTFTYDSSQYEQHISILNDIGISFKSIQKTYTNDFKLQRQKTKYTRGHGSISFDYHYSDEKLTTIKQLSYFTKQEEQLTKFFYKANQLDEVLYFDNGKLKRKLGFLYKSNGLIDAIVERNLDERSVRIYYFMYRFLH